MELRSRNDEATAKLLWKVRLASDVQLFAVAYFPHYCKYTFNELHHDLFNDYSFMERAIRRARAAPRGYAKSTVEALIKPIHDVCYNLEKFILIISNTQGQADQKLRDIRTEILTNSDLIADYGVHFKTKKPGETGYTIHCGQNACLFASFGANAEIRGVRFGAHRPSKIVVDDAEHSEEVQNEAIRQKYEDWYFQVISKVGDEFTNIVVIGTLLHLESLLNKLLRNPAYKGKVYKAVISWSERQDLWDRWSQIYTNLDDDDHIIHSEEFYKQNEREMLKGTKVLWPEKESYLFLMKEMIETGRRAFMKEKQNEPLGSDDPLFTNIQYYREVSQGLQIEKTGVIIPWSELKGTDGAWLNSYGAIDPAAGQTKAKAGKLGDFACILAGLKDRRGRCLVHEGWMKRAAPTKQIAEIFEFEEEYGFQKFGVETNLYRNLLLPNIQDERKRLEQLHRKTIKVDFYDIEQVENKEKRIHTLEPKVEHGKILFNRALSQEIMRQIESHPNPGGHDDAPDTLEMLWGLMNNRYKPAGVSVDTIGSR